MDTDEIPKHTQECKGPGRPRAVLEIIRVGPPARERRSAQKRRYEHREAVMWEEARQDQKGPRGACTGLGAGPRHEEGCSDVVKATEPQSWNVRGSWRSAERKKNPSRTRGVGDPGVGTDPRCPQETPRGGESGDVGGGAGRTEQCRPGWSAHTCAYVPQITEEHKQTRQVFKWAKGMNRLHSKGNTNINIQKFQLRE